MSFTDMVAVARYLRPVYRQKARNMIEELVDKEDVVRQLARFETWGEIAPFLRHLGQLHAFHPSLARAISDAARALDVYSKLARLLPNPNFFGRTNLTYW
jgi:hypothetical protein